MEKVIAFRHLFQVCDAIIVFSQPGKMALRTRKGLFKGRSGQVNHEDFQFRYICRLFGKRIVVLPVSFLRF